MAATVLVAIALLASAAYAGWRQEQAVLEGQRALRMQTFMYRLFKLANSNYTGKPAATVPEFLKLGVKLLPEYIKDPADLREAQMGLAESMYENGDLDSAQAVLTETIASAKAAKIFRPRLSRRHFQGTSPTCKGRWTPAKSSLLMRLNCRASLVFLPTCAFGALSSMRGTAMTMVSAAMRICACCSSR